MAKKEFFLIIDTETTITDKVFDFGAVVVDRNGNIQAQCAIIVKDFLGDDLFYDRNNKLWSYENASKKKAAYSDMINNGTRMVASVNAINRWLEKVNAKYNPYLTAYNIGFDQSKCANSGIDLTIFGKSFCLWHLACQVYATKKQYKQFAMDNHYFGNRTEKGNMTIQTNAEKMAHYVTGRNNIEPHTAIEDAIYFELPILISILKKKGWKDKIGVAYNWKEYQLKDHYKA